MSNQTLEQAKQKVREVLAATMAPAMIEMAMKGYESTPTADDISFWENIAKAMSPAGREELMADAPKREGDFEFKIEGNTVAIFKYWGKDSVVAIPAQIDGKPVSAILEKAFMNTPVVEVTIPDSVASIGDSAFRTNTLTKVNFGTGLRSIGDSAFWTSKLERITIPNGVETIGDSAFSLIQCSSLTIPGSVREIGRAAFEKCGIENLTLEEGIPRIGRDAFAKNNLREVYIPKSVTFIDTDAFANNAPLELVLLPDGPRPGKTAVEFGNSRDGAFRKMSSKALEKTRIITHATHEWEEANPQYAKPPLFDWKEQADETVIISGYKGTALDLLIPPLIEMMPVVEIGGFARTYDRKKNPVINSVDIPGSVVTIRSGAFLENELKRVTIGSGVVNIGSRAFASNQLTSVDIPDSVKKIESGAFRGNKLTKVTLPKSLTVIEDSMFADNQFASFTVPSSVTSISCNAFENNKLTGITFHDGITSIGRGAFENNKLKSVVIPMGITVIEEDTFCNNNLDSVTLHDKITLIGRCAFWGNKFPNGVTIPNRATKLEQQAFGWSDKNDFTMKVEVKYK